MIYLDNNATSPLAPEVIEAMRPWLNGEKFGNPSSGYRIGREAKKAIELARGQVAGLLDLGDPAEVIFTSGGTESNNMAIHSALSLSQAEKPVIVSTTTEHSATENVLVDLEKSGRCEVVRIGVDESGHLDSEALKTALALPNLALLTMIHANNETGVIFPVEEISQWCREQGIPIHADTTQAVGKIDLASENLVPHMRSLSAHKFHGPKGVGALIVDRGIRFRALFQGGGQEGDRRSGTENVPAIVGLGAAAELAKGRLQRRAEHCRLLRDRFENGVLSQVEGTEINGTTENRLPNTTNLFFPGVDGEGLLILLDQADVACSPGSACGSGSVKPSRVLMAMGQSTERARSSVRFSLSEMNTEMEIDQAIEAVRVAVGKLRVVMPRTGGSRVRVNS